jgi:hypothetical protein
MRTLAIVVVLVACDLRPAPKLAPLEAGVERIDAPEPLAPVAADAEPGGGLDAADVEPSADCVVTAQRIAGVVIEGAGSDVRANYENGRTNMIRTMARACTVQGWNADKQHCFQLAQLPADVRACEAMFPNPASAGSAAPP